MLDFPLWLGIGASLGLWRLARSAGTGANRWVNAGLFVMLLALVGARVSFALQNLAYFARHLIEIPMIWLGGLSWPGAVIGGLLAAALLVIEYRSPRTGRLAPGWLGDMLYPLLPPLAIGAWLGCWQAGCGYGPLAPEGAWWALSIADESGAVLPRWPLQPLAALSLLIFFALLEWRVEPAQPYGVRSHGRLSGLALVGLLLHLLIFSLLAADPSATWNSLRVDSWLALGILLSFGTIVLLYRLLSRGKQRARHTWVRDPSGRQAD